MPAVQSTAGRPLQDISNNQHTAELPSHFLAGLPKHSNRQILDSHSLKVASDEAQSCLRSAAPLDHSPDTQEHTSFARAQMVSGSEAHPVRETERKEQQLRLLQLVAEEEADCILRATTRRGKGTLVGSQASGRTASTATKPRRRTAKVSSDAIPGSVSPSEQREGSREVSEADAGARGVGAGGAGAESAPCNDTALSAACQTPAPRGRPQDDVEMDGADVGAAPTPILPMTARRKGRFAAMQTLQVSADACDVFRGEESMDVNECKQTAPLFTEGYRGNL